MSASCIEADRKLHYRECLLTSLLQAQLRVDLSRGQVSQSAQIAPFDDFYQINNASTAVTQYNTDLTYWNTYLGGFYQQAASSLTYVPNSVYTGTSAAFATYGKSFASFLICYITGSVASNH